VQVFSNTPEEAVVELEPSIEPATPKSRRGWKIAVAVVTVIVVLAGVVAGSFVFGRNSQNGELQRRAANIASLQATLNSTKSELSSAQSELSSAQSEEDNLRGTVAACQDVGPKAEALIGLLVQTMRLVSTAMSAIANFDAYTLSNINDQIQSTTPQVASARADLDGAVALCQGNGSA
jgi:hypothetical protein